MANSGSLVSDTGHFLTSKSWRVYLTVLVFAGAIYLGLCKSPRSSVTFYVNREALTLNGRYFNLEYGSYAPGAPDVFINDARFKSLWFEPQRYYLVAFRADLRHLEDLVGQDHLNIVVPSGGKLLLTNYPLERTGPAEGMPYLSAAVKNSLAKLLVYR